MCTARGQIMSRLLYAWSRRKADRDMSDHELYRGSDHERAISDGWALLQLLVGICGLVAAAATSRFSLRFLTGELVAQVTPSVLFLIAAILGFGGAGLRVIRRAIVTSNSEYRALVDNAKDAIVIVQPNTGRIVYMNDALARQIGVTSDETLNLTMHDIFATKGESLLRINERLDATLPVTMHLRARDNVAPSTEVEVQFMSLRRRGKTMWAYRARDVSRQRDNESQLREKQRHLDRIANHDQLTGLPNRHYMSAFLPEAIASAKAANGMIGIVFLDLDRFKLINDTHGHEVGDKLLEVIGHRLRRCVREMDVVVRMGGDEFVIVLINIKSHDEIARSAQRITESLAQPVVLDDRQLQTSASIGISVFPRDGEDLTTLLKHADTAMYHAKDRGRNNAQIFAPVMNRKLKHRVTVEVMLREAVNRQQLEVFYQPFVDLRSRLIVGLEALVRWRHPVRGMIPTDWFITIAEETGLIIPIGEFVLQRAMSDMETWRNAGAALVPVSLNVAPAQLLRGDFRSAISRSLNEHSFSPELLQIEMTERALFDIAIPQSGEPRQDSIAGLRDLGIKVAIDDFGTGYSSLAYLKNWRVDTLKIDRSFIRDLGTDSSDYAIVSAILAMARQLQIEVVAEGVEGYQQDDILRKLGCQQGQGFLYARPLPGTQCLKMLDQGTANIGYNSDDTLNTRTLVLE
jgi:diguanylate cyclase (GGDEF)-like protein/PAS domain S-box-containing protein